MTRQQRWAKGAFERVQSVSSKGSEHAAKYRTHCMKMPVLLKQSGLVQAVAFLRSRRGDEAASDYCNHLAQVYGGEKCDGKALQEAAHGEGNLGRYLALCRDVVAVSVWFRRFAQSELPSGGV